jgi:hypothetical protein
MYASEYYSDLKPSPLNNGTLKIEQEIPNSDIIAYYGENVPAEQIAASQPTVPAVAPPQPSTSVEGAEAVSEKVEPLKYDLKGKSIPELREILEKSIEGIERPSTDGGFRPVSYYSEILKNNKFRGFFGPSKIDAIVEIRKGKYDGDLLTAQSQQPSTEVKKKELFTPEKGVVQKSFRGKTLNFVDKIPTQKETVVAMSNNRKTGVISIDTSAMFQKFRDKAWTKPAKQLDGSFATPLTENEFSNFDEFFTFALIHEVKHDSILKQEGETTGQYEDRINQAALADLRENYNLPAKATAPEVRYKDEEKRIRIEYPKTIQAMNSKLDSSKLLEVLKLDQNDIFEANLNNYDNEVGKKYGPNAQRYAEVTSSEITKEEGEFFKNNPEFANEFLDAFETDELSDGKTIQEYAQALLDQNERLVDTAQMSLFDPNNEDLEGADEPNPCGQ